MISNTVQMFMNRIWGHVNPLNPSDSVYVSKRQTNVIGRYSFIAHSILFHNQLRFRTTKHMWKNHHKMENPKRKTKTSSSFFDGCSMWRRSQSQFTCLKHDCLIRPQIAGGRCTVNTQHNNNNHSRVVACVDIDKRICTLGAIDYVYPTKSWQTYNRPSICAPPWVNRQDNYAIIFTAKWRQMVMQYCPHL